ncbi:MAG: hypothetical protein LBQ83_00890 [Candidatus Margulisbacteria bacterium]|jgi:hypothetical protein|nr:hypothetical protein [Candidatus Margulisiibacteriota bacterium]
MYSIKAIYDGRSFKPSEPIPVEGEYEVVITFTIPVNSRGAKNNSRKPGRISRTEKNKIASSLFGVLPADVDLDKMRAERLR